MTEIYLSSQEKKMLAGLSTFGPQQIHRDDWKEFQRLERAGIVTLSPEIEGNDYRTVSAVRYAP